LNKHPCAFPSTTSRRDETEHRDEGVTRKGGVIGASMGGLRHNASRYVRRSSRRHRGRFASSARTGGVRWTRHAAVDSQRRALPVLTLTRSIVARETFREVKSIVHDAHLVCTPFQPLCLCHRPCTYARRLVVPTSFTTTSHVCRSQGVVAHWSTTPDGSPGQGNREGARCGSRHLQRGHTHVSEGTQHTQHTHTSLPHDRSTAPPATPTSPDATQPWPNAHYHSLDAHDV
jgi:hypothetical protein